MHELEEWLGATSEKDRRQQVTERHGKLVEKLIRSGEGGAGFLHKVTKPNVWTRAHR